MRQRFLVIRLEVQRLAEAVNRLLLFAARLAKDAEQGVSAGAGTHTVEISLTRIDCAVNLSGIGQTSSAGQYI
jgi:hypothetical protein